MDDGTHSKLKKGFVPLDIEGFFGTELSARRGKIIVARSPLTNIRADRQVCAGHTVADRARAQISARMDDEVRLMRAALTWPIQPLQVRAGASRSVYQLDSIVDDHQMDRFRTTSS